MCGPAPVILLYKDGSSDECSVLMNSFKIIGHGEERAHIYVGDVGLTIDPGTTPVAPEGDMSLTEKLTLRFEKAFAEAARGETGVRVDLRFCTGKVDARKPEHDSLRADYAGGWKP